MKKEGVKNIRVVCVDENLKQCNVFRFFCETEISLDSCKQIDGKKYPAIK